jgi:hypothetical protein
MVPGPPGVAGTVIAVSLAPRQVAGAMAVHCHAEVVTVREPETRADLVGSTEFEARDADGGTPRSSQVHCRPVPDIPRPGAVAVVFPRNPEIAGPRASYGFREVSPHPGATRPECGWAAWFKIDATRQYVAQQGYVTARNANLLYPAIGAPQSGSPEMVFTITSATINPSVAYNRLGSGQITTVAVGTGPHLSFSDAPPFNWPAGVTTPSPSPTPTDTASGWPRNTSRRRPTRTPWTTGEPTYSK